MKTLAIHFEKYNGAGNHIILIDNRHGNYDNFMMKKEELKKIFDDVGADGMVEMKSHNEHLFEMVFYNNLGDVEKMCGNGGRMCIAYSITNNLFPGTRGDISFYVQNDGEHAGYYDAKEKTACVSFRDIPVVHQLSPTEYLVDSGLPHLVVFADQPLQEINIEFEGRRLSQIWKEYSTDASRVIVNFVRYFEGKLYARCYNTPCLNEIGSCGTGSVAVAISYASLTSQPDKPVEDGEIDVHWPGGLLTVKYRRENDSFSNLLLGGPIRHVLSGIYYTE